MAGWVIPAITAAGGLIGAAVAKGKDKRQLTQQAKLNQLQVGAEEQLMNYSMGLQMKQWQDTSYSAQKEQMKKAGINPALMYGMGGGGGQSMGNPTGNVTGAQAPSGSGRELEEGTSMGLALASQLQLNQAQVDNINADTKNKNMDTLDKAENKTGKEYDNIVKEILLNRDKDGNLITDESKDMDRVAVKERVVKVIQDQLENINIEKDTARIIAQVAQGWKDLNIKERQLKLNELMNEQGMQNKDQDQIINVINMVLSVLTHGAIHLKNRNRNMTTESYENKDGIQTYRTGTTRYHK